MFLFGRPNIKRMKARRDVEGLLKALKYKMDSYEYLRVRQEAAEALGEMGDPRAVQPLITAIENFDKGSHKIIVEALAKIGAPAVGPLIAAFKGENEWIHDVAEQALKKIGAPAVAPLIAALLDKDATARWYAARALCELYKQGQLNEEQKTILLSHKENFITHTDEATKHFDKSDYSSHADTLCASGAHDDSGAVAHQDTPSRHIDYQRSSVDFPL